MQQYIIVAYFPPMSNNKRQGFFSNVLFKTQMCKNGQHCMFKQNCAYAHDEYELRSPQDNAQDLGWDNFQTKICRYYYNTGNCKFGDKCTFLNVTQKDIDGRLPFFNDITKNIIVQ